MILQPTRTGFRGTFYYNERLLEQVPERKLYFKTKPRGTIPKPLRTSPKTKVLATTRNPLCALNKNFNPKTFANLLCPPGPQPQALRKPEDVRSGAGNPVEPAVGWAG